MVATRSPVCPFLTLDRNDLASILYGLTDLVAVYEPVFDDFHSVVDGRLVWWNEAFRNVRTQPVRFGQSLVDTYFEPHTALVHMQKTWNAGSSAQFLELTSAARDRYRLDSDRVALIIKWKRVGDFLVEVGNDVSECLSMQEELADQKTIIAKIHRKRALAVERERIAHNLHDTVIQRLYAVALSMSGAQRNSPDENLALIESSMNSIGDVIDEIRCEIHDVESRKPSPLLEQLEDLLMPIVRPVHGDFRISGQTPRLSSDLIPHLRAVCIEAASNAVRHGRATHLEVALNRRDELLVLEISDNGMGIKPNSSLGHGLHNMRERAKSLGGTMKIETNSGRGTTITWAVPHPGWSA